VGKRVSIGLLREVTAPLATNGFDLQKIWEMKVSVLRLPAEERRAKS
jgi:hypothetical protein